MRNCLNNLIFFLTRIQERLIGFAHVDGGDSSDGKPKVMEPSNVNIFEDQLKRYKEIRGEEIRRLETMLHQQYELLQKLLSGSEGGPNLSSETKKND